MTQQSTALPSASAVTAEGRSRRGWWFAVGLAAVVLGAALLLQARPRQVSTQFDPAAPLARLAPTAVDGWVGKDEPLGANELERSEVENILRFSDYVYRVYRRGGVEVGLYIAYWKPGAHSIVSGGGHSPDVCWVQNGWNSTSGQDETIFRLGDRESLPAQIRSFSINDRAQRYTAFWHVSDGVRTGYALGDPMNWQRRAPVLLQFFVQSRFGLVQAGQYFVRIDSNRPLADLEGTPLFDALLRVGATCGVFGPEGRALAAAPQN